jgi:putative membrane protein
VSERFPRRVFDGGKEPDPRFSLANERTFLAWVRTALALVAAGVALEALALPLQPSLRLAASSVLLVLGVLLPVLAWTGWGGVERAMRRDEPLPGSPLRLPLAVGVALAALLLLGAVLLR